MLNLPYRLSLVGLLIALGGFAEVVVWAQAPVVAVQAVRKLTYPSELGKAYQFEGSARSEDPSAWQPLGDVSFGTGEPLGFEVKPAEQGKLSQFRLREVDPGSVGIAPATLTLGTLTLVKGGEADQMILMHSGKGVCHAAMLQPLAMSWTYFKAGANEGKWTCTLSNGAVAEVVMHFISSSAGAYFRTIPLSGQPALVDGGLFSLSPRLVWGGEASGVMPTDVIGREFTVQLTGQPMHFEFKGTSVLCRIGNGSGLEVPYVYESESPSAGVLHIARSASLEERLTLNANSESSGTVLRQVIQDGIVRDTQSGTYSRRADDPPPRDSTLQCSTPLSLDNLAYDFSNTTSGVVTMEYGGNGEGTRSVHDGGSIQQSSFSFTYTKIDDHTGRILSVYPVLDGTQIDETILHFSDDDNCSGTWERHSSRDGVQLPDSSGNFGPGNPPPG